MRSINQELSKLKPRKLFRDEGFINALGSVQGGGGYTPVERFDLDQLLAYYKFDTVVGGLVNQASIIGSVDEIDNSDGTVTGATSVSGGVIDNAYDFDGIDDKVEMADSLTSWKVFHDGTKDISINWWMRLNATEPDDIKTIISNNDLGAAIGFSLFMDDRASQGAVQRLRYGLGNGSTAIDFISTNSFIPIDLNWHMYTLTYTVATQIVNIFRDGNANNENSDETFTESTANASQLMNFGTRASADDFDLDADLDESSFWGRLLTGDEMDDLFNSGSGLAL